MLSPRHDLYLSWLDLHGSLVLAVLVSSCDSVEADGIPNTHHTQMLSHIQALPLTAPSQTNQIHVAHREGESQL
jgi:hypothetical protein